VTLPLFPSYREIPLTKGQVALVDADDFVRISQHSWRAEWSYTNKTFYAVRRETVEGKRVRIPMAAEVLRIGLPLVGDHITHITLDNRKSNLRVATDAQNRRNKRKYTTNTSGYKGVSFSKRENMWVANIMIDGKYKHLCYSSDKALAARIYDKKAYEVYGEFAFLNFPEEVHLHSSAPH
jgi:hypothetical protein